MACDPELRDITDPLSIGNICVEVSVQDVVSDVTDVSSIRIVFTFDPGLRFQAKVIHAFPHQFFGYRPATAAQQQVDSAVTKSVFMLMKQPGDLSFELGIFVWCPQFGQMIIIRGLCQFGSMQQVS